MANFTHFTDVSVHFVTNDKQERHSHTQLFLQRFYSSFCGFKAFREDTLTLDLCQKAALSMTPITLGFPVKSVNCYKKTCGSQLWAESTVRIPPGLLNSKQQSIFTGVICNFKCGLNLNLKQRAIILVHTGKERSICTHRCICLFVCLSIT